MTVRPAAPCAPASPPRPQVPVLSLQVVPLCGLPCEWVVGQLPFVSAALSVTVVHTVGRTDTAGKGPRLGLRAAVRLLSERLPSAFECTAEQQLPFLLGGERKGCGVGRGPGPVGTVFRSACAPPAAARSPSGRRPGRSAAGAATGVQGCLLWATRSSPHQPPGHVSASVRRLLGGVCVFRSFKIRLCASR